MVPTRLARRDLLDFAESLFLLSEVLIEERHRVLLTKCLGHAPKTLMGRHLVVLGSRCCSQVDRVDQR